MSLGEIRGSDFQEDILRGNAHLGKVSVDYRRERQHVTSAVHDDRIQRGLPNDAQIPAKLQIRFQVIHQLRASHRLRSIERDKGDLRGWQCPVNERSLDLIQVVRSNGNQSTIPTDVLVELLLKLNEAPVGCWCKSDVPENGAEYMRADRRYRSFSRHVRLLRSDREAWRLLVLAQKDSKGLCKTLQTQEVMSVRWDVNLVDDLL